MTESHYIDPLIALVSTATHIQIPSLAVAPVRGEGPVNAHIHIHEEDS